MRRLLGSAALLALTATACTSDADSAATSTPTPPSSEAESAATSVADTTSTTTTSIATTTVDEPGDDEPGDTSNPDVVSRRTTVDDVDVTTDPSSLPEGYRRAAVPVDAWAAIAVGFESVETDGSTGGLLIEHVLSVCELIAVWALPHPDYLVIGYEEHPGVDCDQPDDVMVTFEIDPSGLNSEGSWDYSGETEIRELRKVGADA